MSPTGKTFLADFFDCLPERLKNPDPAAILALLSVKFDPADIHMSHGSDSWTLTAVSHQAVLAVTGLFRSRQLRFDLTVQSASARSRDQVPLKQLKNHFSARRADLFEFQRGVDA